MFVLFGGSVPSEYPVMFQLERSPLMTTFFGCIKLYFPYRMFHWLINSWGVILRILFSLVLFILASVTSPFALADSQTAGLAEKLAATATHWKNQSGSVASLSFSPSTSQPGVYTVSGNYVNNAAGFNCQGTPYPLAGVYYAATRTISFTVAWSNGTDDCASVTGWTGYLDPSKSPWEMVTSWNLAYTGAGGGQILRGSDTFTMNIPNMSESILKN